MKSYLFTVISHTKPSDFSGSKSSRWC